MTYRIHIATPDDSPALLQFFRSVASENDIDIVLTPEEFVGNEDEERQILADFATSDNSVYFIATTEENEVIGFLCCKGLIRKRVSHVTSLSMSVLKQWRGKKVGHTLMEAMVEWGRQNSAIHRIELSVTARNARAIHLYEKFGFQEKVCAKIL